MESKIDRRIDKRVKLIKWPAKILIKNNPIDGTTRNISVHGAFIYYFEPHGKNLPLQLHKVVNLIIEPPGVTPLFICAEVMWSNILSSDEKNTLLGVGLRFIEVSDKARQFLHDFVTVHTAPMLYRAYNHPWSIEEIIQMVTSLDPDEIKRAKLHSVKCPKCKADLMIRPTEKVCPVCRGSLPKLDKR